MNKKLIVPVILCGGKGTRLWPLSRTTLPKQFLSLGRNKDKTLFQNTIERISNLDNFDQPILICNEENRFIVAEQLREINVKPKSIILEPFGRGTAPAIAIAALKIKEQDNDDDPCLLVLSSDHEILGDKEFFNSINIGLVHAMNGRLVTFGVIPRGPSTAYGYIQSEEPILENHSKGSRICSFIEKPNLEKAKELFSNKRYTWNSGIFLFKSNVIIKEINKFEPSIIENCKEAIKDNLIDLDFQRINKNDFLKCPNIPIDVAVMEKTKLGTVVPFDAIWRDLGSWEEVWKCSQKDNNGNVIQGNVIIRKCSNSFFYSEKRLVAGVGIENLIVIETPDAVLVLNKDDSQQVKEVVEELNIKNLPVGKEHQKILRPWGSYTTLIEDLTWKVKKIVVNPHQSLSLQMHNFRAEHWVVIEGKATVEIDGKISYVDSNQSTYIPLKSKHRLSNEQEIPLVLMEVQSGESVKESDIVRFEDNYGRVHKSDTKF